MLPSSVPTLLPSNMPTNIPSLQPSVRTDHTIVLPVHIGKTVHVGTPVHIGTVSHHHAIILPVKMRAGTVSHQMSFNYYYIFHLYRSPSTPIDPIHPSIQRLAKKKAVKKKGRHGLCVVRETCQAVTGVHWHPNWVACSHRCATG